MWKVIFFQKKTAQTPATLKKAFVQLIYIHINKTNKQTKEQKQNAKKLGKGKNLIPVFLAVKLPGDKFREI